MSSSTNTTPFSPNDLTTYDLRILGSCLLAINIVCSIAYIPVLWVKFFVAIKIVREKLTQKYKNTHFLLIVIWLKHNLGEGYTVRIIIISPPRATYICTLCIHLVTALGVDILWLFRTNFSGKYNIAWRTNLTKILDFFNKKSLQKNFCISFNDSYWLYTSYESICLSTN